MPQTPSLSYDADTLPLPPAFLDDPRRILAPPQLVACPVSPPLAGIDLAEDGDSFSIKNSTVEYLGWLVPQACKRCYAVTSDVTIMYVSLARVVLQLQFGGNALRMQRCLRRVHLDNVTRVSPRSVLVLDFPRMDTLAIQNQDMPVLHFARGCGVDLLYLCMCFMECSAHAPLRLVRRGDSRSRRSTYVRAFAARTVHVRNPCVAAELKWMAAPKSGNCQTVDLRFVGIVTRGIIVDVSLDMAALLRARSNAHTPPPTEMYHVPLWANVKVLTRLAHIAANADADGAEDADDADDDVADEDICYLQWSHANANLGFGVLFAAEQ